TYSDYAGANPYQQTSGRPAFNLYVLRTASGTWFAACFFGKPISYNKPLPVLPCQVEENLRPGLTLNYTFPPDYLAIAPKIDSLLRAILVAFGSPEPNKKIATILQQTKAPLQCWVPPSNTRVFSLVMGNHTWSIPAAYAETAGGRQWNENTVGEFTIFLKLPNLEPLTPMDPSPLTIHGPGPYTLLQFSFSLMVLYGPSGGTNSGGPVPPIPVIKNERFMRRLTKVRSHAYYDYDLYKGMIGNETYVSTDLTKTSATFPPDMFECEPFVPGRGSSCKFSLALPSGHEEPNQPYAGFNLFYTVPRENFSQLIPISKCVGHLFHRIYGP
ncbi:hypothetical protein, partial [Acidocella facilis]|uniref:hypothetical protein n=1 Tax=Acidocella facilis TaxID=525 RepID=UPI001F1858FF